ncbi:MAG: UbiA family prenyltransferase [Candidatus Limnocylindrales bacterium]
MAGVALIAGAGVPVALALGLSMTALQCSIGALNDLHDAPNDGGRQPPKPIPSGLVSPRQALVVAVGAAVLGLVTARAVGPAVLGLAIVVLVIGYGYDLLAKGTAWSWLPFALGVPVLPVYGWLGAVASVPPFFLALVPMAVLAGAALAIANTRADLERDLAAGTESIAVRLGDERAWRVHVGSWLVVVVVGLAWLVGARAPLAASAAVALACVVLLSVAALSRRASQGGLERAWEAEAVAVAVALAAWLAAVLA